jgi:hypothetical protein
MQSKWHGIPVWIFGMILLAVLLFGVFWRTPRHRV